MMVSFHIQCPMDMVVLSSFLQRFFDQGSCNSLIPLFSKDRVYQPKPQRGTGGGYLLSTCARCGRKHEVNRLAGFNACFGCGNIDHKIRISPQPYPLSGTSSFKSKLSHCPWKNTLSCQSKISIERYHLLTNPRYHVNVSSPYQSKIPWKCITLPIQAIHGKPMVAFTGRLVDCREGLILGRLGGLTASSPEVSPRPVATTTSCIAARAR
ncbi:hypothetical protein MTR67_023383 [Solanum verrucosum]|uniref:Uncharacterized protein n=1 Tax=Solanum verrucosum TaxID=315347 RepID=A0AAF0QVD1_SOLVR|nr:hypothetical protein MTR67_023383 [Solanum verrucosum]